MAYSTSLHVNTVSPPELFPYPKILYTYFLVKAETEYAELSSVNAGIPKALS
jgi:hypothetical protein